uniref:NADH-ubiquinone oxidoreductase chain 5 n=1 Tax=Spinomantis microtis TaxID=410576 RepID=B2DCD0_9NEOB|nr:NADH dehydrogenase subunit 5 [Spinomantis microtis]
MFVCRDFLTTSNLVIALILVWPLMTSGLPNFPEAAKKAVKWAFFTSLFPLFSMISQKQEASTEHQEWINSFFSNMSLTLHFDIYTILFLPVALFVTWSILEFSIWYMEQDVDKNRFIKYLLIFLLAMIVLTAAGNFFVLFIGWEGVGLMSFLLIGWYHGRNNAATAASQAVLYNRIGDMGFLLAFCWFLKKLPSAELSASTIIIPPTFVLLALITAAATKSAQFTFHPWLASAMEGPTPVSALLHSSTMVVAGIFLLIRIFPLLEKNQTALSTCLCLGALTTCYAAMLALTQNDVKKIVAYSTSSQLGLMMVAIGIAQPHLAFFHICTHAFFKAMLFLCSGTIIHNLSDEQDIRKMGGLQLVMPVTTTCFSIGSLALMGTPFLAGFYSKDAIIEAAGISFINSTALVLTLMATAFTAVYSLRLIYYISMKSPRTNPELKFHESVTPVLNSISRLAIGSIVAGLIIFHMTFPDNPTIHTMPLHMKTAAICFTLTGFIIAYDLANKNWHLPPTNHSTSKLFDPLHYNQAMHRPIVITTLNTGWDIVTHIIDDIAMKKFSPGFMKNSNIIPIRIVRASQSGLIKAYLSTLLITMFFMLILVHFIFI